MDDNEYLTLKPGHLYGVQLEVSGKGIKGTPIENMIKGVESYYHRFEKLFGFYPDLIIISNKVFKEKDLIVKEKKDGQKGRPKENALTIHGMEVRIGNQPQHDVFLTTIEIYENKEESNE